MLPSSDMMICGSFAKKAGSFGMAVHNTAAMYYGMNFLYKSFSVDNIEDAINAMRTLKFRGAGISMPFKIEVCKYIEEFDLDALQIGAVNTVVNNDGMLRGYNTDWLAAHEMLNGGLSQVCILGDGGLAKAVAYACKKLNKEHWHLCREHWDQISSLRSQIVFNCTPVEGIKVHESNSFIDCLTNTPSGKELALIQAAAQFKLYTGKELPRPFLRKAGVI
jgi:shikimate 5-dehydrogenase